jgi:hypothetical protein
MSANSLTLSWSASTGTAPISYQPQFRVTGSATFLPFGGPLSTTRVVITGLQASTSYDLQVVATNPLTSTPSVIVTAASPIIRGPQNGSVNTGVSLAIAGLTLTDPIATTGILAITCASGTLTMTGAGVTGSGTASVGLSASFASCQAALATVVYTGPATPVVDTINITFTDQAAATHTLLIQVQVVALPVGVAPSAPVITPSAPSTTSMQLNWTLSTGTASILYQPQFKLHTIWLTNQRVDGSDYRPVSDAKLRLSSNCHQWRRQHSISHRHCEHRLGEYRALRTNQSADPKQFQRQHHL